ncbi:olfactory receptor 52I2-like [Anguilla anguilla]|uniref:olfactory receptor 52I2-like n=1 Tax=Anguilla anguilla TaxID=7936 RepID=UPI0015AB27F2|nr:olfactory receptor 52I2-like [Anguilla anguilla]XP_035239660.1 olfactory receptor 52I2-like [Anguilla anguilla]
MSSGNVTVMAITEFVIGGFDTVSNPVTIGIVMMVIYTLVMVANMANICFIALDKRLHKPMYLLVCNLAVVDMVYSSSCGPTMIGVLIAGVKTVAYVPCFLQMFAFHLGGVMEMFAIAGMAFDRLVAISSPLRYHSILTNVRTLLLMFSLWVVACAFVAILPGTVIPLPYCKTTLPYAFCDYAGLVRATCVDPNYYFFLVTVITFLLLFSTFSFIFLSYLKIVFAIFKMSSKTDRKKMYSTCFSHLIVVVCYYVPMFIQIVLTRLGVQLTKEERHGLLIGTILGPSLINPIVYGFRTKEIKNKILKIFTKVEPID